MRLARASTHAQAESSRSTGSSSPELGGNLGKPHIEDVETIPTGKSVEDEVDGVRGHSRTRFRILRAHRRTRTVPSLHPGARTAPRRGTIEERFLGHSLLAELEHPSLPGAPARGLGGWESEERWREAVRLPDPPRAHDPERLRAPAGAPASAGSRLHARWARDRISSSRIPAAPPREGPMTPRTSALAPVVLCLALLTPASAQDDGFRWNGRAEPTPAVGQRRVEEIEERSA